VRFRARFTRKLYEQGVTNSSLARLTRTEIYSNNRPTARASVNGKTVSRVLDSFWIERTLSWQRRTPKAVLPSSLARTHEFVETLNACIFLVLRSCCQVFACPTVCLHIRLRLDCVIAIIIYHNSLVSDLEWRRKCVPSLTVE
jgi:hypothetical protein